MFGLVSLLWIAAQTPAANAIPTKVTWTSELKLPALPRIVWTLPDWGGCGHLANL